MSERQSNWIEIWCGDALRRPDEISKAYVERTCAAAMELFTFGHSYVTGPRRQVNAVAKTVGASNAYHLPRGSLLTFPHDAVSDVRKAWNGFRDGEPVMSRDSNPGPPPPPPVRIIKEGDTTKPVRYEQKRVWLDRHWMWRILTPLSGHDCWFFALGRLRVRLGLETDDEGDRRWY